MPTKAATATPISRSERGTKRPRRRREMICDAAAVLFRERGYRGTSIDEIGAAVGMTGPALYRHFPSKEALLAEILERALERARLEIEGARKQGGGPRAELENIVARMVAVVLEEGETVMVVAREMNLLSSEARGRIVRRQKAIVEAWTEVLRAVRPELELPEAVTIVIAVSSLINASSRSRGLRGEAKIELFKRMALAALLTKSCGGTFCRRWTS
jgi:AcrR family transcriptional regulator